MKRVFTLQQILDRSTHTLLDFDVRQLYDDSALSTVAGRWPVQFHGASSPTVAASLADVARTAETYADAMHGPPSLSQSFLDEVVATGGMNAGNTHLGNTARPWATAEVCPFLLMMFYFVLFQALVDVHGAGFL